MARPSKKRARVHSSESELEVEGTPAATATSEAPTQVSDKEKALAAFNKRWKVEERTVEEVLAAQIATWRSESYAHFHRPEIVEVEGSIKYRFVCKKDPKHVVIRARTDESTGNLGRHVLTCSGKKKLEKGQSSINEYAAGSTYVKSRFRYLLVKWVTSRNRPYAIIGDPELIEIFRMLYARVDIPHATTLSRDVQEIFVISRLELGRMLQAYDGRLHLCLDGWTAPNVISFLGVTIHLVQDGKMESFILDFIKLTKAHHGTYLAEELTRTLQEFGIEKKILGVTTDNATNNDTLIAELESSLSGANSVQTRVRCFAHIINLVVKAIISGFNSRRKPSTEEDSDEDDASTADEADNEDNEEFVLNSDSEAADEREIEEIIAEVEREHALTSTERQFGSTTVAKLVGLAKRIFHSPTLREALNKACTDEDIQAKNLVRVVATRWNSFVEAVIRALYLKPALNNLLRQTKWSKKGKDGLGDYKLSEREWALLTELQHVLEPFLEVTKRVSQSDVPLLHEIIPYIDKLTTRLENIIASTSASQVVRVAAARGLSVLNKYYSRTDESIMYRCAMLLHPKHKSRYFRQQKWEEEWILVAESLLRTLWETYYKPKDTEHISVGMPTEASTATMDLFADIDDYGDDGETDALEDYLRGNVLPKVKDPIHFWTSQLHGGNPLARMALDVLSTPASSTDVERAFSKGGLTVSKRRHALNDASVRASTVLGSWGLKGLLPETEILKALDKKTRRSKKTDTANVVIDVDGGDTEVVSE